MFRNDHAEVDRLHYNLASSLIKLFHVKQNVNLLPYTESFLAVTPLVRETHEDVEDDSRLF